MAESKGETQRIENPFQRREKKGLNVSNSASAFAIDDAK
jgi:hypothetical protein